MSRLNRPAALRTAVQTCQFPIGDPAHADFHFCDAPAYPDYPYCEAHCRVAYLFGAVHPVPWTPERAAANKAKQAAAPVTNVWSPE